MSETPPRFWKKLRAQADQTLGDGFWNDISGLLPTAQPRTDVFQTGDRLFVVIELPGCKADEAIRLSVHKNTLHVKGDLPYVYPVEEDDLLVSERFFGQFHRKIALPPGISNEGMKARFADGLLTIEFIRLKHSDAVVDIAIVPASTEEESGSPLPEQSQEGGR